MAFIDFLKNGNNYLYPITLTTAVYRIDGTVLDTWMSSHTHSQYSLTSHTHTKSQITDFPSSLPANGGTSTYANYVNGTYTGNGGKQPPSYIPSGKVRFNMTNETGNYVDWILMDTYGGGDVPYVSAIGLEKVSDPCLWIMSGSKGGATWTVKRRVPSFSTGISSGQFIIADGTTGKIKTSGYAPSSFAAAGHSHSQYSLTSHEHTYLYAHIDNRGVATTPNNYYSKFIIQGLKQLTTLGLGSVYAIGSYCDLVGIRSWGDSSGGDAVEIAFGNSNQIFIRSGSTTSWNGWSVLSCIGSKPTAVQSGAPSASALWAW